MRAWSRSICTETLVSSNPRSSRRSPAAPPDKQQPASLKLVSTLLLNVISS